jgi:uncharacterized protein (TIGR03118 family)
MLKAMSQLRTVSISNFFVMLLTLASLPAFAQHFTRTDLTVNRTGVSDTAPTTDGHLVNAWGLSRSSGSPWWVSDNGTGVSTLYDGAGIPQPVPPAAPMPLVVTIPKPDGSTAEHSTPTGTVFNYSSGFEVAPGKKAIFLFVTEDGTISGWNPTAQPTDAIITFPPAGKAPGEAVYKGCTLATNKQGTFLYVANFGEGRIDIFDSAFHKIRPGENAFRDLHIPPMYAPFNVQNVGGNLVVTFAKKQRGEEEEAHGPGKGFVAVFDTKGHLLLDLQHGPFLNAPWGVALAPGDFGVFSHRLLIGNFGDGTIHAFNAVTGKFEGTLLDTMEQPIMIDGLWALSFGNNATAGSALELYFTAGPGEENDGLLGKLVPVAAEKRGNNE